MMNMKISCFSSRPPFVVSRDQAAASLMNLKQQQIRSLKAARGRAMKVCRLVSTDEHYCYGGSKDGIDFYKLLSLGGGSESATVGEIKRAYRRMALQYHPDVCHEPSRKEESTRMFVLLHMAYKTLSDPVLRAEYDRIKLKTRSCSSGQYWQEQVEELKIRSKSRTTTESSSWGSRMRARMHKQY